MNARVPTITAKIMVDFLKSLGFQQVRRKGSHRFFRHPDGRTATVPGLFQKIVYTLSKRLIARIIGINGSEREQSAYSDYPCYKTFHLPKSITSFDGEPL